MLTYISIFITAIFVNNIVLSQFLGICPFLGVSKKIDSALGMGAAVTFVMLLSTIVTYLLQIYLLEPFGLAFMQTIAFILVIAALVQMLEIILKKVSPSLYQALGVFLPLITTNCTILGVAIMVIQKEFTLVESAVFAISTALGFTLALTIFAGIREQLALTTVPKAMKGMPIALIAAVDRGHGQAEQGDNQHQLELLHLLHRAHGQQGDEEGDGMEDEKAPGQAAGDAQIENERHIYGGEYQRKSQRKYVEPARYLRAVEVYLFDGAAEIVHILCQREGLLAGDGVAHLAHLFDFFGGRVCGGLRLRGSRGLPGIILFTEKHM